MLRIVGLGVGLFILWLLLSGLFKPLLIGLGVLSCLATMAVAVRMGILRTEDNYTHQSIPAFCLYIGWLLVEIAKSNWAVTKVILLSKLSLQQKLFNVPTTQCTDVGKVLYANSITLTPGTITVETENGYFITHALTEAASDMQALADMDRRVTAIELKKAAHDV
jgi:multicomponent Na+:H+ antiporter subunit E